MSHVSKIELEIKDLEALKAACQRLGFKFREGQKQLAGDCWLNVLVDEDSPTEALVHLTWFDV